MELRRVKGLYYRKWDSPNVERITLGILRCNDDPLPFVEAHRLVKKFNAAHGTGLKVVDPEVADAILADNHNWGFLVKGSPFLTNVCIAYEKPGTALGPEIGYAPFGKRRRIMSTGRFEGRKDIALIAHDITVDDFKKSGRSLRIDVPEDRLDAIPEFPPRPALYMPHSTTIPFGKYKGKLDRYHDDSFLLSRMAREAHPRGLWRTEGSYVGPLVRHAHADGSERLIVDAEEVTTYGYGVVVMIPDQDKDMFVYQVEPMAVCKIEGIAMAELRRLVERFGRDLGKLRKKTEDKLLDAASQAHALLMEAIPKSPQLDQSANGTNK